MAPTLPEQPNLERLKKQAKALLRAAREHERSALERFHALPAFLGASSAALEAAAFALREEVEARTLTFAAAIEEFARCATGGAVGRAERLLELHPMAGHAAATRGLLQFGAAVDVLDGMFAAPPLVWAVEGRRRAAGSSDHVGVARLLIAAGSPLEWTPPAGAPSPEATLDGLSLLRAAATAA